MNRHLPENVSVPAGISVSGTDTRDPFFLKHISLSDQPDISLTLFDNPYISHEGKRVLLFGDLQLSEIDAISNERLLNAAAAIAAQCKKPFLLGPMNGSTWQTYRLPLDGAAPMFSGDLTEPANWTDTLHKAGFVPVATYHSAISTLVAVPESAPIDCVTIRRMTADSLECDLSLLYPLVISAFSRNLFYSPVGEEAFRTQYLGFASLISAGLSYIALAGDKAVGFALAYPDAMDMAHETIVFKTIARLPGSPLPGLVPAIRDAVFSAAIECGYNQVVHAFMQDDNRSVYRSREAGGAVIRRYALFAKKTDA